MGGGSSSVYRWNILCEIMSSEDEEPLVHFEDKDDEDDDFDPYKGLKQTTTKSVVSGKTALLALAVVVAAFVLIAVVAIALGAAGLNRTVESSSNNNNIMTSSPLPTKPTAKPTKPTVNPNLVSNQNCGDGLWNRIIYLNMNDTSQECPRGWRGYEGLVRCCGRPVLVRSSCPAVFFPSNGYQYSKVCGRAIGYQQGSPDAFASDDSGEPQETIDGLYVDGVSLTHGNPRTHIWTFAAGLLENGDNDVNNHHRCPCDNGQDPPVFVGNNYFCETGDHERTHNLTKFFKDDPLWDGHNCVESTCCRFNSPPWFTVILPKPTTDDIEVRICGDQSTGDEDTPIALLEIYVQA